MAKRDTKLFDYLGNILVDKSMKTYLQDIQDDSFKSFQKYMVLRYLSMHTSSEVHDVVLNNYDSLERMPNEVLYRYLLVKIPRQKSKFIKYLK